MLFNKFTTQIETQAGAADPIRLSIRCADKSAKQECLLSLGDTDALIPNTNQHLLTLRLVLKRDLDQSAFWTVLDSVREDIREYLFHAFTVDLSHQMGKFWRRCGELELMALAIGTLLHPGNDSPTERHQIEALPMQYQPSGL